MITETHPFLFPDTYPPERLGPSEKLLFFDIETTGFSGDYHQVYLIGCVFSGPEGWELIQWFADSPESEKEVLTAFFEFLKGFTTLVHFNGDGFDIPFLLKRCGAWGLPYDFSTAAGMDIYKKIRPYRKVLGMESLKQKAVERFLGIFRQDPYSGGQLIEVYKDYLLTHDKSLYHMLMLHNREDLEGMPLILPVLCYPDFLEGDFRLKEEKLLKKVSILGEESPVLCLILESCVTLPQPVSWETKTAFCHGDGNCLEFRIDLANDTLKYFYPDYENYYYLVYEDMAVHKSVGEYVEREARKKATPQTCYTKKTSVFLPQPKDLFSPAFKKDYKGKCSFAEYHPGLFEDRKVLMEYVRYVLE
ncbi:MAG: ribonuclease H-like domain-containing protein [Hungatella sp.]|nr:ribonuclease H-like domain-containing protein [Hungatella sp.]